MRVKLLIAKIVLLFKIPDIKGEQNKIKEVR